MNRDELFARAALAAQRGRDVTILACGRTPVPEQGVAFGDGPVSSSLPAPAAGLSWEAPGGTSSTRENPC